MQAEAAERSGYAGKFQQTCNSRSQKLQGVQKLQNGTPAFRSEDVILTLRCDEEFDSLAVDSPGFVPGHRCLPPELLQLLNS